MIHGWRGGEYTQLLIEEKSIRRDTPKFLVPMLGRAALSPSNRPLHESILQRLGKMCGRDGIGA